MKKLFAIVLCLMLCVSCFASGENEGYFGDFSLELADGSVFTLSEALSTHEVLVINLWGTWCPWCVVEFPFMQEAWAQYTDRIGLICLSAFDTNEEIAAFMQEQNLTILPMAYDSVNLTAWLSSGSFPVTAAFNSFGECIYYESGALTSTESFVSLFEYLLAQ